MFNGYYQRLDFRSRRFVIYYVLFCYQVQLDKKILVFYYVGLGSVKVEKGEGVGFWGGLELGLGVRMEGQE